MSMITLHVAHSPGEQRVVLVANGMPQEFYIHRPAQPDGFGAIHWARVTRRVTAMAGAFVAIAGADAFLPDTEGAATVHAGDHLAVRITRAALGDKGPRVAASPEIAPGPVRLLHPGPTPLEDLQAAYPDAAITEGPFPANLEADLAALADPIVPLPGGLTASITPTPALTAIDLDTAAATMDAKNLFAANRDALPELVRQIRLRNLSGAILIDFAGLPTRKRAALAPHLAAALAPDRLTPRLAGFTPLGFAEILRPRLRPPLHERLAGPHAAALAALRQIASEAAAHPGHRFTLTAAPAIIAALHADRDACAALAHHHTYPIILHGDPTYPPSKTQIEHAHA
jgi:Ribonuclease G/E